MVAIFFQFDIMEIYGGLMRRSFLLLTIIIVIITGFTMNSIYKQYVNNHKQLLKSNIRYPNESVIVSGIITDINLDNNSFVLKTTSINPSQNWIVRTKDDTIVKKIYEQEKYKIKFTVNSNQYQYTYPKNRYAFDYDLHLFSKGITKQYYLIDLIELRTCETFYLSSLRLNSRKWIEKNIVNYFDKNQSGFLMALLLGDKKSYDNYNQIKMLGLAHLFAISGLHFGVIYKAVVRVIYLRNPYLRMLIVMILMGCLVVMVGGAYSALRAFFMIVYAEFCYLFHRKNDVYLGLSISILAILLIEPAAILNTGLHLSYYAYICVAVIYRQIFPSPCKYRLLEGIRFCIALQLLLLPGTLYYFQNANLYSFIANLLAVPMISIILPTSILFLISLLTPLSFLQEIIAGLLKLLIVFFESIGNVLPIHLNYFEWLKKSDFNLLIILALVFALSFVFWNLLVIRRKYRSSLILLILTSFIFITMLSKVDINITFFDVSHGDMSLIQDKQVKIIIDTGDGKVAPSHLLRSRGIHKIDALVLSHAHHDHIGGVESLVHSMQIKKLYLNVSTAQKLQHLDLSSIDEVIIVTDPIQLNFQNKITLDIIPTIGQHGNADPNDDSLIVRMSFDDKIGYFLGDLSKTLIDDVLNQYHLPSEKIAFVKTPHHGSKTSLSRRLYEDYQLTYAVTSHGTRYNLPSKDVIEIINSTQAIHYSTYENGEIQINYKKSNLKIKSFLSMSSLFKRFLLVR